MNQDVTQIKSDPFSAATRIPNIKWQLEVLSSFSTEYNLRRLYDLSPLTLIVLTAEFCDYSRSSKRLVAADECGDYTAVHLRQSSIFLLDVRVFLCQIERHAFNV